MSQSERFDKVLRGGRVIDPAQGLDGVMDVAITAGKIAQIAPTVLAPAGAEVIDVRGKLVLPGMIDTHAHVYQYVTGTFGLKPDWVGVGSGITTVVDQGGPSCMTLPGFRKFIAEPAVTRVVAFISTYLAGGLEGHLYPDLHGPAQINVDATVRACRDNPDLIRGIKAHAEIGGASRWGIDTLKLATQIGREADLPVYVHLGQLWPTKDRAAIDADELVRQIVPQLRPGDILAHPFTRHPGGFIDAAGNVHPMVTEALARGVLVDVGHGSHFSFDMARRALDAGIMPYTLGADLHGLNVKVPPEDGSDIRADEREEAHPFFGAAPFSLTIAMTELLTLGVPLPEIVKMVTSHAAHILKMEDRIGTLAAGYDADVSVLEIRSGRFVLKDNKRVEVVAERLIEPVFCLRAGKRFELSSPIFPRVPLAA